VLNTIYCAFWQIKRALARRNQPLSPVSQALALMIDCKTKKHL
jgi:hypothetical protein